MDVHNGNELSLVESVTVQTDKRCGYPMMVMVVK